MGASARASQNFDVAVIGAGPAGLTAGLYAARAGLSVAVLERISPGGQLALTSHIENYPGFPSGIGGFELARQMKEQAEVYGVHFISDEVTGLKLESGLKTLIGTQGSYTAGAVIIASGARPRLLGVPGESELVGRGVSLCATCDGNFYRGKDVAVVGGGNTAATDALFLARMCNKVTLVHRRSELRASKVLRGRLLATPNVELLMNSAVREITQDKRLELSLSNVVTGGHDSLSVDGVFVAVGTQPNTEFLQGQLACDKDGYIVTDEQGCTSLEGVYAAGDVRVKSVRQVATAVGDGAVCAQRAAEYLSF